MKSHGKASIARFCGIDRLVSDDRGHLYAFEGTLATIKKINVTTGTTSPFAGVVGRRSAQAGGLIGVTPIGQNTNLRFAPGIGFFLMDGASLKVIH